MTNIQGNYHLMRCTCGFKGKTGRHTLAPVLLPAYCSPLLPRAALCNVFTTTQLFAQRHIIIIIGPAHCGVASAMYCSCYTTAEGHQRAPPPCSERNNLHLSSINWLLLTKIESSDQLFWLHKLLWKWPLWDTSSPIRLLNVMWQKKVLFWFSLQPYATSTPDPLLGKTKKI